MPDTNFLDLLANERFVIVVNIVVTTIVTALLLAITLAVARVTINRLLAFGARLTGDAAAASKRSETLVAMVYSIIRFALLFAALLVVLRQLGVSIAPLITGAGLLGLAVAFGIQSLLKDVATGLLVVLEDQMRVGDRVEVAGKVGTVEAMSLRLVRLRENSGAVTFIPHGQITVVTNHSYASAKRDSQEESK